MARSNTEEMEKMKNEKGRGISSGRGVQSSPPVAQEDLEAATALAVKRIMGTSPESPTAKRTRAGEAVGTRQSPNLSSSSGEVAQSISPVRQEVLEAATGRAIEQIMGTSPKSPTAKCTRAGEAVGTTQSVSDAPQNDASTNFLSILGGVAQSTPPVRQEEIEATRGLDARRIMDASPESPTEECTRASESVRTIQPESLIPASHEVATKQFVESFFSNEEQTQKQYLSALLEDPRV